MGDESEIQWLADKGLAKAPRLGDLLVSAKGWELAVETVLGSYLQAISVDSIANSVDLLKDFNKGELLLVGKGAVGDDVASFKGRPLSELVEGDGAQACCPMCMPPRHWPRRLLAVISECSGVGGYP